MSYFERMEKLGQMNIFHYLLLDSLSLNEYVSFQNVKITRQERFIEVETDLIHEVVQSIDEALCLVAG